MIHAGRRIVTPLRFASGIVGLWVAARVAVLLPGYLVPQAEADGLPAGMPLPAMPVDPSPAAGTPFPELESPPVAAAALEQAAAGRYSLAGYNAPSIGGRAGLRPAIAQAYATSAIADPAPSPTGLMPAPALTAPAPAATQSAASPWSGSMYLFRRDRDGAPTLATGGQLGGSQAGGRLAYAVNPGLAVAARVSTPLDDTRGAEAAGGIDWHPLPGKPLRVSVERRVDIGGAGRNAWSAYAAGGFWRQLRPGFVVDGYAQGGIVGAQQRDLFADGALRAGQHRTLGDGRSLTVGGGVWSAAQPGVSRLDMGPRAALGLPVAGTIITAAAEWRIRAAGNASPRSGVALTLSSDF